MKIIWQLFGVHVSFVAIIVTLLLAWLVWPRKYPQTRKRLLRSSGIILLGSILLGLNTYWPREYDKNYLDQDLPAEIETTSLKDLADARDFYIGVALTPNPVHHSLIAKEFNSVTAENHLKPGRLLVDAANWKFDFSKADELLTFAEANGMRMRGHTLIWGKFPGMTFPKQWIEHINGASDKKQTMEALIKRYIETVMGHFKGRIPAWDVVNEPMAGKGLYPSIFSNSMGEEYIDFSFHVAREVDPDCSLFLNEQIQDYDGPQGTAFLALLKRLVERGVPIDGVGLQSHHINRIHDTDALERYIRSIGQLELKVEITELDVRLRLFGNEKDPYQAQGDQFKKIVEVCLNDPACIGVTLWGLTDRNNWMDSVPPFKWKSPNAPNMFDEDMNRKPAYLGIWNALNEATSN
ncbi:MAG: endo-1,4-beta-xylanase [Opitutales bacterium]|nr:endo-1,4-beta-xylanase [Opitutales bacterium]